jgi:hypothetical protein
MFLLVVDVQMPFIEIEVDKLVKDLNNIGFKCSRTTKNRVRVYKKIRLIF